MKYNLVQFENGLCAIRRKRWFQKAQYFDLKGGGVFWWSKDSKFFSDCFGPQVLVEKRFTDLCLKEKVIK